MKKRITNSSVSYLKSKENLIRYMDMHFNRVTNNPNASISLLVRSATAEIINIETVTVAFPFIQTETATVCIIAFHVTAAET